MLLRHISVPNIQAIILQLTPATEQVKKWMLGSLSFLTKQASRVPFPALMFHHISSQDSILRQLQHENFNFQGNASFPYPSIITTCDIPLQEIVPNLGVKEDLGPKAHLMLSVSLETQFFW